MVVARDIWRRGAARQEGWITTLLNNFVVPRGLGRVLASDGPIRLQAGQIRIPDSSFISRERLRGCDLSQDILPIAPNLAVEILRVSNTRREMSRKLDEYFDAGVELVWFVEPRHRVVQFFTSPTALTELRTGQTLTGGRVLPGFVVTVDELFAPLDRDRQTAPE